MATEREGGATPKKQNSLVQAVREIKIASAERNDVVVDMKEADRARLEILAQKLETVFDEVPLDDERFDFAISSGLQPRLWIDATAHVMMGKDRRQYRFVRDTRLGRVVLAESTNPDPVSEAVTKYIAERLYEREMALAGDDITYRAGVAQRTFNEEPVRSFEGVSQSQEVSEKQPLVDDERGAKSEANSSIEVVSLSAHDKASSTHVSKWGWILLAVFVAVALIVLNFRDQLFGVAA